METNIIFLYISLKQSQFFFWKVLPSCVGEQPNAKESSNPRCTFISWVVLRTLLVIFGDTFILKWCSVQLLSCVQLFATPWTAVCLASLSINKSQNLLKLMSIESVMPSNHLILCHPFSSCPQSFPASGSFLIPGSCPLNSLQAGILEWVAMPSSVLAYHLPKPHLSV